MSLQDLFSQLQPREKREYATITGQRSNGTFTAKTRGDVHIILYGTAEVGNSVWYDVFTNRILDVAPVVRFIDVEI